MATASGNTATAQTALAKAGKDLVAQLLPMAAGSQEATAEVSALAQIVGGPSTDSFQALAKWVGNTKGAESDLNNQQAILTLSTANLTAAAKNLSAAVGSEVTSAEAQAIAQTVNLSGVTLSLAKAFSNSQGAASSAVITYAGSFYESLIKAGTGAVTAQQDVDSFLTQLGATSGVVAKVNAALASLPKQVNIDVNIGVTTSGVAAGAITSASAEVIAAQLTHAAGGGVVRGSGPSGRDSTLIMAAPGELIIPASHAPAFHDQARKAGIPGFAAGGIVSEPVYSTGSYGSMPYSYAMGGAEQAIAAGAEAAAASAGDPLGRMVLNQILGAIQQQNKLMAQQPYAYADRLNQAAGAGVRRGVFMTGG